MPVLSQYASPGLVSGFLQSYGRELRGWASRIGARYAIAVILLLSGGASLVAAIGVGIAACFHWLEIRYGSTVAYEAVIGVLALLGAVSALIGIVLIKIALPPVPRPHRHGRAAGRSVAAKAAVALSTPRESLAKADLVTEMMIGVAAACLLGWLVSSRSQTRTK
jgi:hypothetical protein